MSELERLKAKIMNEAGRSFVGFAKAVDLKDASGLGKNPDYLGQMRGYLTQLFETQEAWLPTIRDPIPGDTN